MDIIEHRVRERAYFIWEDEGRVAGRAEAHWMQALAELTLAVSPAASVEAPVAEASPVKASRKAVAPRAKAPSTAPAKAAKPAQPKALKAKKTAAAETVAIH